jgi:hypothetical protein
MNAGAMNVQIREGRPFIDGVYINGHGPYRFLVDTGATLNHFDLRTAKSIGLTENFHTTLTSSVGVTAVSGGGGVEVTVGQIRIDNQIFLFAGVDAIQQSWPDVQGVLGEEFLSHLDYFLDMRGKTLEFGRRTTLGSAAKTPFKVDHGRPVISTNLGWLVLDSGAPRLIRFGLKAAEVTYELRTMSGSAQLGTEFCKLIISGHSFWQGDATALAQTAERTVDGLLPTSLFKSVYVSNSEGFIILE